MHQDPDSIPDASIHGSWLCICIFVYIKKHIHIHTHIYIYMYTHISVCIKCICCVHIYICVNMVSGIRKLQGGRNPGEPHMGQTANGMDRSGRAGNSRVGFKGFRA